MSSPQGARSATGRSKSPLGWLPWVLLLVLAVVVALVVVLVVNVGDDKRSDGAAAPAAAAAPAVRLPTDAPGDLAAWPIHIPVPATPESRVQ